MKATCSLLLLILFFSVANAQKNSGKQAADTKQPTTILYHKKLSEKQQYPELLVKEVDCQFTQDGLVITDKEKLVQLDKFYSLGERLVRYHVQFSADAIAVFQSNTGDFKCIIDVKMLSYCRVYMLILL